MRPPDAQFDCPLCGGEFEAPTELLGQEVACPHCSQVIELPSAAEIAQEPVAPVESATQPTPTRNPTREEREKARRRFNLVLAIAGALILALAFVLLQSFG